MADTALMEIYFHIDLLEAKIAELKPTQNITDPNLRSSLLSLYPKLTRARTDLNKILDNDALMGEFDNFADQISNAFKEACG